MKRSPSERPFSTLSPRNYCSGGQGIEANYRLRSIIEQVA